MRWTGLVLSVVLIISSAATSHASEERVIVPGARIGKWTLAMTIGELLRLNGAPSSRPSMFGEIMTGLSWFTWDAAGLGAATRDNKRVEYIGVTNPDFKTQKGIGAGSTAKAVLQAYGEPAVETDIYVQRKIITTLAYDKIGFAVFLTDSVVQMVLLFRPGALEHLLPDCG